jgi:hypothetical protein
MGRTGDHAAVDGRLEAWLSGALPWPRRVAAAAAAPHSAGGPGRGGVHAHHRHVVGHEDLLRAGRQRPARRCLPRQQRHPGLRLRPHGTHAAPRRSCTASYCTLT